VKIADLYTRSGLTLSVEFFAPKTDKGDENLLSEIELIKQVNPAYCSVTYGAGEAAVAVTSPSPTSKPTVNVAPCPGVLSTLIFAPIRFASFRTR